MSDTTVIKKGQKIIEPFNEGKLKQSIYSSCLTARSPDGVAKDISEDVVRNIIDWLKNKPEVTSNDIRIKASDIFSKLHPDAAYLYKNNKKIM